jgi:hypothetical protein
MAITYAINGSAASIAPTSVQWLKNQVGVDHNGAPIFSTNNNIIMTFDPSSATEARQWLDLASTGGSYNLTTLDQWKAGTTILSSIYFQITRPPVFTNNFAGPFTLTVLKAVAP